MSAINSSNCILKAYEESVFEISEYFIKVNFLFSVGKVSVPIDKLSGDDSGGDNGDKTKILKMLGNQPDIRCTLTEALLATLAGTVARVVLAGWMGRGLFQDTRERGSIFAKIYSL